MIRSTLLSQSPDTLTQLEETRKELDAFLYRASHDLKGPLARLEGLTQLIHAQAPDPAVQFSLNLIETLTQEMHQVINDLIHVQGLFNGQPTYATIDARQLLDEIQQGLTATHPTPPAIAVQIDGNTDWYTDRTLTRMIIEELLKNAYQVPRPEGVPALVELRWVREQEAVMIEVKDNGTGIQPQHIDRLFELFFKGHDEHTGSGLGLYLVRKAAFQLGGRIEVESDPGHFSCFRIHLPVLRL